VLGEASLGNSFFESSALARECCYCETNVSNIWNVRKMCPVLVFRRKYRFNKGLLTVEINQTQSQRCHVMWCHQFQGVILLPDRKRDCFGSLKKNCRWLWRSSSLTGTSIAPSRWWPPPLQQWPSVLKEHHQQTLLVFMFLFQAETAISKMAKQKKIRFKNFCFLVSGNQRELFSGTENSK